MGQHSVWLWPAVSGGDGNYIFSDLLEIPNLWQRSRVALLGVLRQWCWGLPWQHDLVLPERRRLAFAVYAVEIKRDQERWTLRSPIAGVVIPPPESPPVEGPDENLPVWSGLPLDEANLHCHVDRSTLFSLVGDPDSIGDARYRPKRH